MYLTKTFMVKTLNNYNLLCYVKCSPSLLPFKAVATSLYHSPSNHTRDILVQLLHTHIVFVIHESLLGVLGVIGLGVDVDPMVANVLTDLRGGRQGASTTSASEQFHRILMHKNSTSLAHSILHIWGIIVSIIIICMYTQYTHLYVKLLHVSTYVYILY